MPFLRYFTNKLMSAFTSKLLNINLSEFHTGYKIFGKEFFDKVPFDECSNNYLFSFQIILQAKYFDLKYGEISISSSGLVSSSASYAFTTLGKSLILL